MPREVSDYGHGAVITRTCELNKNAKEENGSLFGNKKGLAERSERCACVLKVAGSNPSGGGESTSSFD
jgi:hypothetical protein